MSKSDFAKAILAWRQERHLTQSAMAALINVAPGSVSRWESGHPISKEAWTAATERHPALASVPPPRRWGKTPSWLGHGAMAGVDMKPRVRTVQPAPKAAKAKRKQLRLPFNERPAPARKRKAQPDAHGEFVAAIGEFASIRDAIAGLRTKIQDMHAEVTNLDAQLIGAEKRTSEAVTGFLATLRVE